MKETTPTAMPPCFDKWCRRFDDIFTHKAQKAGFRHYLGGLLGESERKNLTQLSKDTVGVTYHRLHHFLTAAPWNAELVNQRRWEVMQQCSQTKIRRGFTLIIDDSGHRKSGKSTAGVGRQYIGLLGKTDNGVVLVTTHLLDGVKSLPLDVSLYQHASSLPQGKQAPEFIKKPDIALKLIDKCLERGEQPGVVLIDAGYGNNSKFLQELESRKLRYIGGLAKNRKVLVQLEHGLERKEIRLDELAKSLNSEAFTAIQLKLEKPRTVWVATIEVELPRRSESKTVAIVMNAATLSTATEVDYLITNATREKATDEWVVTTYSQRNWVEVFYREALVLVRIKRVPSKRREKSLSALDIGVLCLQFYCLASVNWWTETKRCSPTFRDIY